jgi:type I restriction enzyme R subunit
LLEKQVFRYVYGHDIAPDGKMPERSSFEDVLLLERLKSAVARVNPAIPADARDDAIKRIERLNSPELITNNESFHRMLTEGITVTYQKNGNSRGDLVWLIDFDEPDNNDFMVVNQYTVIENHVNKRPDILLFVNGLPLVVVELKNPADENATVMSAFRQLETYKQAIPSLFVCNGFLVASDGLEARAGTITSGFNRFMAWKSADGKVEASPLVGQIETLVRGMLNRRTLLDLIRHFIVFEKTRKASPSGAAGASDITVVRTEKKLAAYHQYYAVNRRSNRPCGRRDTLRVTAITRGRWLASPPKAMAYQASRLSPSATVRAAWYGTHREAASRCPWCSIRERSFWLWTTPPWWSSPTGTTSTTSCSKHSPPRPSCCARCPYRPKAACTLKIC